MLRLPWQKIEFVCIFEEKICDCTEGPRLTRILGLGKNRVT